MQVNSKVVCFFRKMCQRSLEGYYSVVHVLKRMNHKDCGDCPTPPVAPPAFHMFCRIQCNAVAVSQSMGFILQRTSGLKRKSESRRHQLVSLSLLSPGNTAAIGHNEKVWMPVDIFSLPLRKMRRHRNAMNPGIGRAGSLNFSGMKGRIYMRHWKKPPLWCNQPPKDAAPWIESQLVSLPVWWIHTYFCTFTIIRGLVNLHFSSCATSRSTQTAASK